ncbi:hypothetical protein Aple_042650 [Acrocarpospora pleiomorpha]|uniref:Uncharacterized protein n=1 Tax=Acrocarpospora pleiomorpha TaxID=90975 RepID=A0A5M3XMK9_9ACTN|nr:hypothetical protein Aple_042650 [Acrocarpospora pleiomorpha]
MALDHFALLDLLESLKADADDIIRRSAQALIYAEATAVIGTP